MTNIQLYLAIGIPMAFNALLLLILRESLRDAMKDGFEHVNQRFDDMRALWTSELNRVEGVLDARLKYLDYRRAGINPRAG
jgi:hypothetical protein